MGFEDMNKEKESLVPHESDVLFRYSGIAYNRPHGRGICLVDDDFEELEEKLPEGDFHIEIVVTKNKGNKVSELDWDVFGSLGCE